MSSAFAAVHAHMRRQQEIKATEIGFVDAVVYTSIAFILVLGLLRWCRRSATTSEPLGAIAFMPAVLDAVFGGNRRERALRITRREPVAARVFRL